MQRFTRGFTLIELLVVIAIIGILSSVVLASLNSARVKGRDARRISDVKQLQLALELYYDTNQSYPVTASGGAVASTSLTTLVTNNFISSIPMDPTNTGSYVYWYGSANSDGTACTSVPCASYVVRAVIEGASAIPAGDVDTTTGGVDCSDSPTGNYCMRP